jgi:hypothetical protein
MKTVKLILLFGMVAFVAISCSNSLTSTSKSEVSSNGQTNTEQGKTGTTITAQDTLFAIVSNPSLDKKQAHLTNKIRSRPTTEKLYFAHLKDNPITLLRKKDTIALSISPDKYAVVVRKGMDRKSDGDWVWSGLVQNNKSSSATLAFDSKGKSLYGTLRTADAKLYEFESIGNGLLAVILVDQKKFPPPHPPSTTN